jgi:hypothetical protein
MTGYLRRRHRLRPGVVAPAQFVTPLRQPERQHEHGCRHPGGRAGQPVRHASAGQPDGHAERDGQQRIAVGHGGELLVREQPAPLDQPGDDDQRAGRHPERAQAGNPRAMPERVA